MLEHSTVPTVLQAIYVLTDTVVCSFDQGALYLFQCHVSHIRHPLCASVPGHTLII